jgi:acyl carrier protein
VRAAEVGRWLTSRAAELLGIQAGTIDPDERLSGYGLESRDATRLIADLGRFLGRDLPVTLAWSHPTIAALSQYLACTGCP